MNPNFTSNCRECSHEQPVTVNPECTQALGTTSSDRNYDVFSDNDLDRGEFSDKQLGSQNLEYTQILDTTRSDRNYHVFSDNGLDSRESSYEEPVTENPEYKQASDTTSADRNHDGFSGNDFDRRASSYEQLNTDNPDRGPAYDARTRPPIMRNAVYDMNDAGSADRVDGESLSSTADYEIVCCHPHCTRNAMPMSLLCKGHTCPRCFGDKSSASAMCRSCRVSLVTKDAENYVAADDQLRSDGTLENSIPSQRQMELVTVRQQGTIYSIPLEISGVATKNGSEV